MPTKRNFVAKKENDGDAQDGLMEFEQFVSHKGAAKTRRTWPMLTLIVLVVVLAGAIYWLNLGQFDKPDKFKAIFLDNNQLYFAKVVKEDSFYLYLDEVYYIQNQQQTIPATEEGQEDQIVEVPVFVKHGTELHKPQGWLQLNRERVFSIEVIGDDSQVMQEIQRMNSTSAQ